MHHNRLKPENLDYGLVFKKINSVQWCHLSFSPHFSFSSQSRSTRKRNEKYSTVIIMKSNPHTHNKVELSSTISLCSERIDESKGIIIFMYITENDFKANTYTIGISYILFCLLLYDKLLLKKLNLKQWTVWLHWTDKASVAIWAFVMQIPVLCMSQLPKELPLFEAQSAFLLLKRVVI